VSPKIVFSALLCVAASFASAQSINLGFPDAGDRQVWIYAGLPIEPPTDTDGLKTLKADAALPIGASKPNAGVFIWDRKTGNLASKTVKDAGAGTWNVKPGDFQDIAEVTVHVEHSGKPVAAAQVELNDGRRTVPQLLAPSNNGSVTFFAVKPGSLKVSVKYKVAGKEGKPVTQLVDESLARAEPIPTITISLPDAVDTVDTTPTSTATNSPGSATSAPDSAASGKAGSKDSGGSFFGSLLIYLISFCAMAAVIYYAMRYMKTNPDSVSSKLEALGVQIPKPGDDPLTNPASMPMPRAPAPVQKIVLDNAAPDLISSVVASTVISDPRLVSQSGDAMPLPEGDLIVGRDVGLGLSLVGESTVSRKHAQLTRSGSTVILKDFGSTNGTFVNGVQIQGEKQLQIGDSVQFGSVRFRFEG